MAGYASSEFAARAAHDILEKPPPSIHSTRSPRKPVLGLLGRLFRYAVRSWRRRSRMRAYADAQLALGERMFAVGIDDGEVQSLIIVLDNKIRQAEAAKASTKSLKAQRQQLLMRLGAAALEEDAPLPGADNEYHAARRAEAALQEDEIDVAKYGTSIA